MSKSWKNTETEFVQEFLASHPHYWHDFRSQVEEVLACVPDEQFLRTRKVKNDNGGTAFHFRPGAETVLSQLIQSWVKANVDHNLWLRGRRKSAVVFPFEKLVDITLESRVDWLGLAKWWLGRIRDDIELERKGG